MRPGRAEQRLAGHRLQRPLRAQVHQRCDQRKRRRRRTAGIADFQRQRQGQAAASGIAGQHHRPARGEFIVGGQGVVERGGERVFGRQPVVENVYRHAAAVRQPGRQAAVRAWRAGGVTAAVQEQHGAIANGHGARVVPGDGCDATQHAGLVLQPAWQSPDARQHAHPAALEDRRKPRVQYRLHQQPQRCPEQGGAQRVGGSHRVAFARESNSIGKVCRPATGVNSPAWTRRVIRPLPR